MFFSDGADPPAGEAYTRSFVEWVIQTGTDYALEYSVQTGLNFVQAGCAVFGLGGLGFVARRAAFPIARPVEPLYRRLHAEGGPHLRWHERVSFGVNPYAELSRKTAVILQGRTQEGKTTLLRTSIPWIHRWNIFGMRWLCWKGIYLNGAEGCRNSSFESWVTTQMFGITTAAGSEIKRSLWEFRHAQWFRLTMETLRMPVFLPRPLFIIVDQFEELMKRYPEQAIPWADAVASYHTRNNLARVIFVVNSEAGANSLLNLDWKGSRFTKVVLKPVTALEQLKGCSSIDRDLFAQCEHNVGLHNIALQAIARGQMTTEGVPELVQRTLKRWELDFQVAFPLHCHTSWLTLELPEAKRKLARGLEVLLREGDDGTDEEIQDEVQAIMAVVRCTLKRLDARQLFQITQSGWTDALSNKYLATPGLSSIDAIVVAKHIMRLMGNAADWKSSQRQPQQQQQP
ncbi:unnamed protein product [Polarella glacialis]|uniref:Uncharacterized protein n=1 Tax=Polarella glacialis TaxID=89957 RepID=A0A813IJ23_POLGL|nr:unnamed protein product [Polarella glacialis]